MCSILCYSQGTQMPPSIGFLSVRLHHHHFAHMYIHALLQCHHLEENTWLITSEKIYSQIYLLMNHLPYYPDINYIFLQCPLHSRQPGAEQ